jgi:hypothetical protein
MKNSNSASALLGDLTNQGCRVWAVDDRLRLADPKGVLTDALRAAIREHKAELLRLLQSDPANDRLTPCRVCDDVELWPRNKGTVCVTCFIKSITPNPLASSARAPCEQVANVPLDLEAFIAERCLTLTELTESLTGLYRAARQWCEARGEAAPSLPAFQKALVSAGFGREKVQGRAVFQGISLNAPPEWQTQVARQAICSRCGGTTWGPSGRVEADGCEAWHCLGCAKGRELRADAARAGPPSWYGTVDRRF